MRIPSCAIKKPGKDPLNNPYFQHANNAWKQLRAIKGGQIKYCSDNYSMLINTLERYYKGLLQAKADNDSSFVLKPNYLTCDHDLIKLANKIRKDVTEIFGATTQEEIREMKLLLFNLRKRYTSCRYSEFATFAEFLELYKFVELQREIILEYIDKEFVNKQTKDPSVEINNEEFLQALLEENEFEN